MMSHLGWAHSGCNIEPNLTFLGDSAYVPWSARSAKASSAFTGSRWYWVFYYPLVEERKTSGAVVRFDDEIIIWVPYPESPRICRVPL